MLSILRRITKRFLKKQFIVIYRDAVLKDTKYIEIVFLSRNYQHLTGLVFLDDKGMEVHGKADYFYKKCFEKKLANKDIAFKKTEQHS